MAVTLTRPQQSQQLTRDEVDFYNEHGFLRLRAVYTPTEVAQPSEELDYVIENFATRGKVGQAPGASS